MEKTMYVLRRTHGRHTGKFVCMDCIRDGDYTMDLWKARLFPSIEEANRDSSKNGVKGLEEVVPVVVSYKILFPIKGD